MVERQEGDVILVLRPEADDRDLSGLRRLLKRLGRAYRLRCVWMEQVKETTGDDRAGPQESGGTQP